MILSLKVRKQINVTLSRNIKKRNTKNLNKLKASLKFVYLNYNFIPFFTKNQSIGLNKSSITNLLINELAT